MKGVWPSQQTHIALDLDRIRPEINTIVNVLIQIQGFPNVMCLTQFHWENPRGKNDFFLFLITLPTDENSFQSFTKIGLRNFLIG